VYYLLHLGPECLVVNLLLGGRFFKFIFSICHFPPSTGFGGCVDLIVDGVSFLNKIGISHTDRPVHHDYLENADQLAQSFAYFFAPGAAAE